MLKKIFLYVVHFIIFLLFSTIQKAQSLEHRDIKVYWNVLNGIGFEYDFFPKINLGILISFPQPHPNLNKEWEGVNYAKNPITSTKIEETKYYNLNYSLYLNYNFFKFQKNEFYLVLGYTRYTQFYLHMEEYPLSKNPILENWVQTIEQTTGGIFPLPNFSYKMEFPVSNEFSFGLGYNYWFNQNFFIKITLQYAFYRDNQFPERIHFFPNIERILYYEQFFTYRLENILVKEDFVKNDSINKRFDIPITGIFAIGVKF